ncbi:MAG: hypothetical protein CSA82_01130 [Actinobacteria bacterium]|nr:MAG: hypothetical protein CSA82_01130 [Actinomycetota bacterium]
MAALLIFLDRRIRFYGGQVFSLYLIAYSVGRIIMETMRLDPAREYLGIRLNSWTSIFMIVIGIILFLYFRRVGASTSLTEEERARALESIKARKGEKHRDTDDEKAPKNEVEEEVVDNNSDSDQTEDDDAPASIDKDSDIKQ